MVRFFLVAVEHRESKPTRSQRYHHGNLRAAAVAAAVEIIKDEGLDAVSMRNVAARAGVTHSALYQHFRDKRTLLSAVSEQGYRRLADRMRAARRRAGGDELAQIQALAVTYVFFAADEPAHFRIMNEPELTAGADEYPPLWEAHNAVVDLIFQAVEAAQLKAKLSSGDAGQMAMTLWTFTHGYAETSRTQRGFFHEQAEPPRGKPAIRRHFLAVFEPLLAGLREER